MTKHKQYGTKDISIESLLHRPTFINSRNTLSNTKLGLIDFYPCKIGEFCFTPVIFCLLRLSMLKNFFLAHFYSPKKKTTVGKNELEKNA
jgi:hypothetical protein